MREADFTTGSTGGSSGTLGNDGRGFAIFRFDLREEQFFEAFRIHFADGFFFREDAFLDEVVGDHGFILGRTFTITALEEVQRGNAIDFFDRELGILHVFAFMLKLLARGFEFVINGMESFVFLIAKGFERQGVADIVVLFMVGRAISPAAQYARPLALCPAGIRAFAPGYVLDRCAVCAHTPGGFRT